MTLEPLEDRSVPATFIVTSLGDELGAADGDGTGDTLRECLYSANNNGNSPGTTDLIQFDPGILGGVVSITYGDLFIDENVIIEAGGAGVTVDFNNDAHLEILNPASYVQIDNVDFYDGFAANGGAIANYYGADLHLLNLQISSSYANADGGGAVYQFAGYLTIENCTLTGNYSEGFGGAIYFKSASGEFAPPSYIHITNSLIFDNSAVGDGGGLWAYGDYGSITIANSTIANNSTGNEGGGVYIEGGTDFTVTIYNSTIAYNYAAGSGGGVYFLGSSDYQLHIFNSTIAENEALYGGGIIAFFDARLYSTIVANNAGYDLAGSADFYAFYSLIGDASNVTFSGMNNILYADPLLGPLTDNGGPTPTMALLSGSPAINTGINPLSLSFDQRGPFYYRTVYGQTDIGAYEFQDDDTTPPTIILYGCDPVTQLDGVTQEFSWYVYDPSGLSYAYVLITQDGIPIFSSASDFPPNPIIDSFNFDSYGLGTFRLYVMATDADGDYPGDELTSYAYCEVIVIDDDTAGPTITLGGSTGLENDGESQYFTWDVYDPSGVCDVEVTITQDGSVIYTSADTSGSFNFDDYGLGTFEITVNATDCDDDWVGDDSSTSATRSVSVYDDDTAAPTITLGGCEPETQYVPDTQEFAWNVTDPSGVALVTVLITKDGEELYYNPDALASGSFNFDAFGAGLFEITVTATDGDNDWEGDSLTTMASCDVTVRSAQSSIFAVGSGSGIETVVQVYDDGKLISEFNPFPGLTCGVTVATGDVNGDGIDDVIVGAGAGAGPHVKVYDVSGPGAVLIESFFAFDASFRGGVLLAAGDVNGDGNDDVIVGAGAGGGPHVKVFSLSGPGVTTLESFFAFDPSFTGGVRVASGDVNGDEDADIIAGAGFGGGPHVQAFDATGPGVTVIESFFAFDLSFTGGIFVAAGDINGDGFAEIIVGAGLGGGPHVKVFDVSGPGVATIRSFFAFDPTSTNGVRVGSVDFNLDGFGDIIVGTGRGTVPRVKVFNGTDLGDVLADFLPFGALVECGVLVG